MARVKQQRPPDFLAPAGQQEILDRLAELRLAREAIGPGVGKVYLADVHAFADRVFADLEAEAARKKGFRLAELRALLTLELESGQDVVTLEHVDGLDPAEVHAVVDQRAPDGYTDAISERVTADDDEAARKIEAEIVQLERRHAILEAREARAESDRRIAELAPRTLPRRPCRRFGRPSPVRAM